MPGERILICEREEVVALDLQTSLHDFGYEVLIVASTVEQLVHAAYSLKPELIVTEVHLQGRLDGIDAVASIKSTMDLPVIYLTADPDRTIVERAKSTNPNGFLLKPFSLSQLAVTIEMALHNHRSVSMARSKVLPLCSYCKRIREGSGAWTTVEEYFTDHFDLKFTHSLCPRCAKNFHG